MNSTLYVDLREAPRNANRKAFGVPEEAYGRGLAWRVICPVGDDQEAATLVGFARKSDAELAKAALEAAGAKDVASMAAIPFEERNRLMLEALQW